MMNEHQFCSCLESLGVANRVFSSQIFKVFDSDRSGSIELKEFTDCFRQLCEPGTRLITMHD